MNFALCCLDCERLQPEELDLAAQTEVRCECGAVLIAPTLVGA